MADQSQHEHWDPDFTVTVAGSDITHLVKHWVLEDIEDGISSLKVIMGNPDAEYGGQFTPENDISIQFGYDKGEMSPTIEMKIKDVSEKYPTGAPPTITLVGLDCTEKLVGVTHAGNSNGNDVVECLKSLITGAQATPKIGDIKPPDEKPDKYSLHNKSSHAAIRWFMGQTKCNKKPADAEAPIKGQPENITAGEYFPNAESVPGYREMVGHIDKRISESTDKMRLTNAKARAGSITITATAILRGIPTLKAKSCVTWVGVGEKASGKWYIRRLTQEWDVKGGYTTHLSMLRPTLGTDGKAMEQPIVLYAEIYEKDTIYVGCRKIDDESQMAFIYGIGTEVVDFTWSTKLQRGRGQGEITKMKHYAANSPNKIVKVESEKDGNYSPTPPPQVNEDVPRQQ